MEFRKTGKTTQTKCISVGFISIFIFPSTKPPLKKLAHLLTYDPISLRNGSKSTELRSREEALAYNKVLVQELRYKYPYAYFSVAELSTLGQLNRESDEEEYERLLELDHKEGLEREAKEHAVAMGALAIVRSLAQDVPYRGGSVMGMSYTWRNRNECKLKILRDYINADCIHGPKKFRRRFRMQRPLFLRIKNEMVEHDDYFTDMKDCTGREGVSRLQKICCAIKQLSPEGDGVDEYHSMGSSTALECLYKFCQNVIEVFEKEYLRPPTRSDVNRIIAENVERGFPGMLGSLDCMHWVWKNCPIRHTGAYTGYRTKPTVILEVVADKSL